MVIRLLFQEWFVGELNCDLSVFWQCRIHRTQFFSVFENMSDASDDSGIPW
jgi:hypothetical protein